MKLLTCSTFLVALLATGCVEKETIKESTTTSKLTKNELLDILVGNTFPFSKGGMYFATNSKATVQWDGKIEETDWYATDASSFCFTVELFGGKEECLGLERTPTGDYMREFEGNSIPVKASDIKEGKTF